ncbi:hypothetical protein [Mesorhizobium sp. ORM16]|uniref:hypothetical protein n=1 Tax=Mesorhizobium sp. ORM16 TaxID=3376989 RepID=UPI00385767B8
MPQLDVYTNNDAEVFVLNAALSRVARSVGSFSDNLSPGLYKIRVSRAGTFQEQLVELSGNPQQHSMFIDRFSAVAPIGPMLSDVGRVESLARAALERLTGPRLLVLAHQSANNADHRRPFQGARIFPWRATRDAVRLDGPPPTTAVIDSELWAAVAVEANAADGPFVLELSRAGEVARQAVLVATDWQTRIFLRASNDDRPRAQTPAAGAREATPFDVSIQMARPTADVVYSDHWETVEVARSALERGRAIFTSQRLVEELLYEKYENPVAGLTGLHLFLDAKARSEAGDTAYDLAPGIQALAHDEREIADEVLVNLTRLLHPERAAAAQKQADSDAALKQVLVYADPDWPEPADLTALRLRAGRCRQQVFVPSPPMFRVSWDVLKANAARDGLTWISRELWSSTGAAGSAGPYLAWARGRHSVKRTLQRISDQFADRPRPGGSLPFVVGNTEAAIAGSDTVRDDKITNQDELSGLESRAIRPSAPTLESMVAGTVDNAAKLELAASFGLPLSILQKAPDKLG